MWNGSCRIQTPPQGSLRLLIKTLVHSAGLVHASVRAAILAWCSFYRDIRPGQHADAIVPGNLWAPVTVFSAWALSHP